MQKIGFIGAGKMAQALAGGIAQGSPAIQFVIVDPSPDAQIAFQRRIMEAHHNASNPQTSELKVLDADTTGKRSKPLVTSVADSQQVFDACQTIFLAVKPQMAASALANLRDLNPFSKLIVSVMAGVTTDRIQELTHQRKVVRIMPNTPCLIGLGASAMACTESVSAAEADSIHSFLESIGIVERVEESLMDAVTGLSGSGPAYVFSFIESLVRGGIVAGLDPQVSDRLARQTVLGAVTLLNRMNATPAELKHQVTSPGGTTLAGLERLEKLGFDEAIIQAVVYATRRSRELGQS